ncbi:type VI secretion protein [Herbaspirillum rubrisubalbicans]|uniref:Type VI secretion protein n=1 Tax=Herbaspirillum rubrisubalbicans TaxID=80842 RepID=A0ABX9C5H4_9BURK|nr:type VI secretion system Vgr family protein [Herbaspirillum rubrisubalbicans]RAM65846.1 type VI secretion protein [Herbaspirillum rubrisubalbicans]RAN45141.1 type VI secretion protein [Herbaspirillum rubrisubalbicans]
MSELLNQLVQFTSATRLYSLSLGGEAASADLLVEAFAAAEGLHGVGLREVIALSLDAGLPLTSLIGRQASLQVRLSDGSTSRFSGLINEAAKLGSEGGFARYRLRLVPWIWLLGQSRNSRVWQDKTVIEIVEDVFAEYAPHAAWTWSDEVASFMQDVPPRSYVIQYRESNLEFVSRLLAAEGLSWRVEESADAAAGHRLVLFADSSVKGAFPEDASSAAALGGAGIRFHGASAREQQDSIQALAARRTLQPATFTLLSYDDRNKQAIATSLPTHHDFGHKDAPRLESYDSPGLSAYSDTAQADRYAQLHLQASEARNKLWQGRSTVRTLRPGTRFSLAQGPLGLTAAATGQSVEYAVLSVFSIGVNNLPKDAEEGLAELFGPLPPLLEECVAACQAQQQSLYGALSPDSLTVAGQLDLDGVIAQARKLGYANAFEAIRADVVWRPVLADGTGLRRHARATARGSQSAIVVGPDGNTRANGADEIYCDRLGRVRIRFHWQGRNNDAGATCWVRVAQRAAAGGHGMQFLPRIGQEVLVQFLEDDIDRPIILGALCNGQGEGAQAPTPGGEARSDAQDGSKVFASASDFAPSGQGNVAGGNAPTWHGGSQDGDGHRNAAAQWGIRSKEFGGAGYNQLLFDDTDAQGRVQLKTSQAATELNLGHLIHAADNYRGSFRGTGAELRTDAYGAIRAASGILFSSYRVVQNAGSRDPAGDNAGGMALLKQAALLGKTFNEATVTHKTVALASHVGPTQANASIINDNAAPLEAIRTAAAGMVDGAPDKSGEDVAAANTQPSDGKLPQSTSALIGIAAREGLGAVAGQHLQLANGETVSFLSGQDSQHVSGNQLRLRSGQALGVLAGAIAAGEGGQGLQMIAAQQNIDVQAQAETLAVQARDQLSVVSANASVDWAAAKKISLSTADGANITIEGGNITVQCPGKLTIHAAQKVFEGPVRHEVSMPSLPRTQVDVSKPTFNMHLQDIPGPNGVPMPNYPWRIVHAEDMHGALVGGKKILNGRSDDQGKVALSSDEEKVLLEAYNKSPNQVWLVYQDHVQNVAVTQHDLQWSDSQQLAHALSAMGYTDVYGVAGSSEAHQATAALVKEETGKGRGAPLIKKILG